MSAGSHLFSTTIAQRITNHIDEADVIRGLLTLEAPLLIRRITRPAGSVSLRELARMTGLSPTYLSEVATGKKLISHGAYLKLYAGSSVLAMRKDKP